MIKWIDLYGKRNGQLHSLRTGKEDGLNLALYMRRNNSPITEAPSNINQVTSIVFNENGQRLYCAFQNGMIYCVDLSKNRFFLISQLYQCITVLGVEAFRGWLLVGLADQTLNILDDNSGDLIRVLRGHSTCISAVYTQPSKHCYAVTVGSSESILWNIGSFKLRCQLNTEHTGSLLSVCFIPPDGDYLIASFASGFAYIWDVNTLECIYQISIYKQDGNGKSTFCCFAFTKEGRYLFAASRPSTIHLWRLNQYKKSDLIKSNLNADHNQIKEVIQLPESLYKTHQLVWIPNCHFIHAACGDIDEELSGVLAVLSGDRRLRFLLRKRVDADHQPTVVGRRHSVQWCCIATVGIGSAEDPWITRFAVPPVARVDFTTLVGDASSDRCACSDPLDSIFIALTDRHGRVHLRTLSVLLQSAVKSAPPQIKVDDLSQLGKQAVRADIGQPRSGRGQSRRGCAVNRNNKRLLGTGVSTALDNASGKLSQTIDPAGDLLNRGRLRLLLKQFGQFPEKYRLFIWRALLQLPCNSSAFNVLIGKGIHPAYELLPDRFPIRGQKLMRSLQKVCSALAYWSPLFGETDWLPLFAFPFIKLFQNNLLQAFEVVATVLINWCSAWFDFFPNPPINVLCMIENLVAHNDAQLYNHLVHCRMTTEIYAWPLLQTVFSEVCTQSEWLCLWDTLICHPPGLLIAMVVAYAISARGVLLPVTDLETLESFFQGQNTLAMSSVLGKAHQLLVSAPTELHPDRVLATVAAKSTVDSHQPTEPPTPRRQTFQPLTSPHYQLFSRYPKFIVDFHIREREKIREEEREYLRQKATVEDMQRRAQLLTNEEQNWYRQQELLLDAEERRRKSLALEEEKLADQRKRLGALIREVKLHELTLAEESRSHLRQLDLRRRKAELAQMEAQLTRLARQRLAEVDSASQAAELANLEQALQQRRAENWMLLHRTGSVSDGQQTDGPVDRNNWTYNSTLSDNRGDTKQATEKAVEKSRQRNDSSCSGIKTSAMINDLTVKNQDLALEFDSMLSMM